MGHRQADSTGPATGMPRLARLARLGASFFINLEPDPPLPWTPHWLSREEVMRAVDNAAWCSGEAQRPSLYLPCTIICMLHTAYSIQQAYSRHTVPILHAV